MSIKEFYQCSPMISPEIYTDLSSNAFGISTIPPEVIPTTQIPDMVLLWRDIEKITLIELTVPFEMNIESSTLKKENKYAGLVSDLKIAGYDASLIHIAIGSNNKSELIANQIKIKSPTFREKKKDHFFKRQINKNGSIGKFQHFPSSL